MYFLQTDERGKVVKAHRGVQVVSRNDAGWTEVEHWADRVEPPLDVADEFPPEGLLFFDIDTLVDFCRCYGYMLHVAGSVFVEGIRVNPGGRQWTSLRHSVAIRPEDEGPHNTSGIVSDYSLLWVPQTLFESLSKSFGASEETDPLWCVSSRPVKRAFVYLDVSGFSKYAPGQEALIINTLVRLVHDPSAWKDPGAADALQNQEAELCIGDGYIYVFPDPLKATVFASWLAELIQQLVARREQMGPRGLPVAFHFRMGVHYGPVYRFWDPGRRGWNYIGDGINGGNRVLSVIDKKYDDILFVSDAVVNEFIARRPLASIYASVRSCLENRGRQEDKHGKWWRVFLLNHTKLCEPLVQNMFGPGTEA
jgi:class 3 adenylate cyclase